MTYNFMIMVMHLVNDNLYYTENFISDVFMSLKCHELLVIITRVNKSTYI